MRPEMHTTFSFRSLTALAVMSAFLTVAQAQQGGGAGQGAGTQQGGGRGGGRGGGQQPARDAQMQQAVGTAMILGQVVTGDSGTPVRRARVNLIGQELRGQKATMTDDEGRFVFTLLPAGRYTVNASKAGYVNIAYGAKGPGRAGTPIQLADGQKLEVKAMSLPKGGVVTGTVLDEHGEPAPGTTVRAMRQVIRTGEKRLESAGTDTTDDRGQYRIYGLVPGQFVVYAQPRNQGVGGLQASIASEIEAAVQQMTQMLGGAGQAAGRAGGQAGRAENLGDRLAQLGGGRGQALEQLQQQLNPEGQQAVQYAPVFYPGSTSPSNASRVEIVAGQERFGVDFQLQLTQTSQVDGVVLATADAQPNGTQITLVPKDSLPGLPGNTQTTRAGQNGQFTFRNVIPGQYSVVARGQLRVVTEGSFEGQVAGGRGGRGGGRGQGLPPPEVLWAVADLTVDGRDQTGVNLQLQRGMTISGRIAFDGQGAPPTDLTRARINLMPVGTQDVDFGAIPPAMADASGRFTLTGVPPGRYSLRGTIPGAFGGAGGGGGGGRAGGGAVQASAQPAGATQAGATVSWQLASSMAGGRDSLDFP